MRKIAGLSLLLAFLAAWIVAAATVGSQLTQAPQWLQLGFYVIAGIGWVLPLKPLMSWMNRGTQAKED